MTPTTSMLNSCPPPMYRWQKNGFNKHFTSSPSVRKVEKTRRGEATLFVFHYNLHTRGRLKVLMCLRWTLFCLGNIRTTISTGLLGCYQPMAVMCRWYWCMAWARHHRHRCKLDATIFQFLKFIRKILMGGQRSVSCYGYGRYEDGG